MSKAARSFIKLLMAVVLITLAALVSSKVTWAAAGTVQTCTPDQPCEIGEFLYDDNYSPITSGATCTITSRYPDGTLFLNAQSLTSASEGDGWYSHTFTTPSTVGLYRTTITCLVDSQTMSIDKSFEVQASTTPPSANDIASATWNYSSRSLTTFGNLVSDIWGYASRTLTGAGLSSGSLATKDDVSVGATSTTSNDITNIYNNTQNIRDALENLINKPVVQNQTVDVPDLNIKLKSTTKKVSQLSSFNNAEVKSANAMVDNWNNLSQGQILDALDQINQKFGGDNDKSNVSSMFGILAYLSDSWGWNSIDSAGTNLKNARNLAISFQTDLQKNGKTTTTHYEASLLADAISQLGASIGNTKSKTSENSLFGELNSVNQLAVTLDKETKTLQGVLGKWSKYTTADKELKIKEVAADLADINVVPSVRANITDISIATDKDLKNQGYYILGIISTNEKILAMKSGSPLSNTWLELGSIVFKSIATNPSTYLSQDVDVKYYLPPEIKKSDITSVDPGLDVTMDPDKNQYVVSGTFHLAPLESKTVSVETKDIWTIKQSEIDSLRKQADDLSQPLENSAFFAEGVTTKAVIDASLNKIEGLMASSATPEDKIQQYREAEIELKSVQDEMGKLKELDTQASSQGAFLGSVVGAGNHSIWGLVIIALIGFICLTVYMRFFSGKKSFFKSKSKANNKSHSKENAEEESKKRVLNAQEEKTYVKSHPRAKFVVVGSVVMLLIGGGIGTASGVAIGKSIAAKNISAQIAKTQKTDVLGEQIKEIGSEPTASQSGKPVSTTESSRDATPAAQVTKTATVLDTPTGFLRVRKSPGGEQISQVNPGDKLQVLDEQNGWIEITLKNGDKGWVSAQYVTLGS